MGVLEEQITIGESSPGPRDQTGETGDRFASPARVA